MDQAGGEVRAARFTVSPALIEQVMQFPPSAQLAGIETVIRHGNVELVFIVNDHTLPEADEPHDCTPVITKHEPTWDWRVPS